MTDEEVQDALDRLMKLTPAEFEAKMREDCDEARRMSDEFDRKLVLDPLYLFKRVTL